LSSSPSTADAGHPALAASQPRPLQTWRCPRRRPAPTNRTTPANALAYDDGCSVFPPREHEGLLVEEGFMAAPKRGGATGSGENDPASVPSSPPFSSASSSSSSSSRSSSFSSFVSSSRGGDREAWRTVWCGWAKRSFMELARRVVRSGYELLYLMLRGSRAGRGFDGVKQGAVWSSAAVAALAALLLLSVRQRSRRRCRPRLPDVLAPAPPCPPTGTAPPEAPTGRPHLVALLCSSRNTDVATGMAVTFRSRRVWPSRSGRDGYGRHYQVATGMAVTFRS
ncbi:hypothetical protein Taro_052387, partial [Colocasia esculenta]|nr:hypothetical protein [Colocasia esculenta]